MYLSRKKISSSKIFIYLMLLIFVYPKFIDYNASFLVARWFINHIPYFIFPFVIIYFWNINKDSKVFYLYVVAFRLCFFISNIVNGANFNTHVVWAKQTLWILGCIVFVCSSLHYNEYKFLRCSRNLLFCMVCINILFQLFMPQGIAQMKMGSDNDTLWLDVVGFIDADNRLSLVYILYIYIDLFLAHYYPPKSKIKCISIYLCIFSMLVAWSGSGLVSLFVISLYFVFRERKIMQRLVSAYWILLVYIAFIMVFVIFRKTNIISFVIVDILHKSIHLGNRIALWSFYLLMISSKLIFGYGTETLGVYYSNWQGDWYAHNQILDLLVQGGMFATVFFAITIIKFKQIINKSQDSYLIGLSCICLLSYLVMGIVEHFFINNNLCIFVFLAIGSGMAINRIAGNTNKLDNNNSGIKRFDKQ